MPYYQRLGQVPRKHHIWFHRNGSTPSYKNEGIAYEHVFTTQGFDEAYSIGELQTKLTDWSGDRPAVFTPIGLYPAWDDLVTTTLNEVRNRVRTGIARRPESFSTYTHGVRSPVAGRMKE